MRRVLSDNFRLLPGLTAAAAALAVVLAGTAVLSGAAVASAPKASEITLHFFLENTVIELTNASGRPASLPLVPGDVIIETDLLDVGNHTHHARHATASDHYRCVIVPPRKAVCDGQVKIGSSKLVVKHAMLTAQAESADLQIAGGSGTYRGCRGIAKFTDSHRSDLTIVVRR